MLLVQMRSTNGGFESVEHNDTLTCQRFLCTATFVGEFAQSRRIAAAVKLAPGRIFGVGLARFGLENENCQGDKLRMVDHLAAGVA